MPLIQEWRPFPLMESHPSIIALFVVITVFLTTFLMSRQVVKRPIQSRSAFVLALVILLFSCITLYHLISIDRTFTYLLPFAIASFFIVYVDVATQRIPNVMNLLLATLMTLTMFLMRLLNSAWQVFSILICGAFLFGFFLLLNLVSRGRIGMGDVKLAYSVGIATGVFGFAGVFFATLVAFILSGLYALGLLMSRRVSVQSTFAFGPFMIVGSWLSLLMGSFIPLSL